MSSVFYANNIKELELVAKSLIEVFGSQKKIVFFGEMGVGKTSLIKSICRVLNVKDVVTSPTFSIVNEYFDNKGDSFYHFDFFRIKNKEEVYDLGYEEYFDTDSFCFIEWPEKILNLLPKERINLKIINEKGKRVIKIIS